jgi:RNA recognition motif-containing protein
MPTKLYVDHLPFCVTDTALQSLFERVGHVINCDVVLNGTTRISKATAFVEMATEDDARRAIDQLDGKELDGRPIKVVAGT